MTDTTETGPSDLWIFGYGSLMWRPGIVHMARVRARVHGYHRRLCVWSEHYRGTRERPGLVMGLDRGGSCNGVAYLVSARQSPVALAYLDARELIYGVYRRIPVSLTLVDRGNARVRGISYVVDRRHPLYAGDLTDDERIAVVRRSIGAAGSNRDYLASTIDRLAGLHIPDAGLERIADRVRSGSEDR